MNDLSITKFVDTNTGQPNFDDVVTFMLKFGLLVHRTPGLLKQTELNDRIQLIDEERDEFKEAAEAGDLARMADALIDLAYVTMGTAAQLGLPWQALWADVQRANMAKVPGMTKRGQVHDVCKPPGWVGPQTEAILYVAGWDPDAEPRGYQQTSLPL